MDQLETDTLSEPVSTIQYLERHRLYAKNHGAQNKPRTQTTGQNSDGHTAALVRTDKSEKHLNNIAPSCFAQENP